MIELKDLNQNTPEWHAFRNDHVGASDAGSVMGVGYLSPLKLYEVKLGLHTVPQTEAMKRGHDLEKQARWLYSESKGEEFTPLCAKSSYYSFMSASFDGISEDRKRLVEIKTGGQKTLDLVLSGKIPDGHYAQCQHQLEVAELQMMDYCFYDGKHIHILQINRDNVYINRLIQAEKAFWHKVLTFDPPEASDADYELITDPMHLLAVDEYVDAFSALKRAEDRVKSAKESLIHFCNDRSMKSDKLIIRKQIRKGMIDYSRIEVLKDVDLEPYRKEPTKYWLIK